eukprot:c25431_g1_i1 orf=353-940(+)
MDHTNNVQLVEEEKFGWTILSTVHDGEAVPCNENPATQQEADLVSDKETDEHIRSTSIDAHGEISPISEQKSEEENEGNEEEEDDARDAEEVDADDELEDCGFDDHGDDGVFPFADSARGFLWDPEPRREANTKTLVEQQAGQKQGLMWRVSLVATLGFFGWAVMTGLSGGGKNLRCFKLHPCGIKEGEPVLSTL